MYEGKIENKPKRSYKEIIDELYNIFIPPENPNNPRYDFILKDKIYTLQFLAKRTNIPLIDLKYIFKTPPLNQWAKIMLSPNKKNIEVFFKDLESIKKFILMEKRRVNKEANLKYFEKTEKLEKGFCLKDLEGKLSNDELNYLKLILKHNPSKVFSASRIYIPQDEIKKLNLRPIHLKRNELILKLFKLGVLKRINPSNFKLELN
jgi:hypothetical protein